MEIVLILVNVNHLTRFLFDYEFDLVEKNLTISLEEEEYDGTGDEEKYEFDESEGHVSQICGNIDIIGLGTLTGGVTFPHIEFPTVDFSTQETQIPPPWLGDYPGWIIKLGAPHRIMWHTIPSIAMTSTVDMPIGYDFFAISEGMQKHTLDRTLDLEARHLHDESRMTHLTMSLRYAEYHLSQLNGYLDGQGVVVDWEDDEGKAGTSQAGTSRGRVLRGRTLQGGATSLRRSSGRRNIFSCLFSLEKTLTDEAFVYQSERFWFVSFRICEGLWLSQSKTVTELRPSCKSFINQRPR
ncbi:hypothetical protein GIB67_008790, partial [Kingdonia uniflora]